MFRKSRNRILLLNMAMASAVTVIAFAVIFFITQAQVQKENLAKLQMNAMPQLTVYGRTLRGDGTILALPRGDADAVPSGDAYYTTGGVVGFSRLISPDAGLSFSLLVDSKGNVMEANTMVDMPETVYQQAAYDAMKNPGSSAAVTAEGRLWQYVVSPVIVEHISSGNISLSVAGEFSLIRFLDVTDSHQMLRSLALTLFGLLLVILTAFFFISRFFANSAVRPMEQAWEKQGRFVADASHELKTPLSVIQANCGVLYENGAETVDSQLKWVDRIMDGADRMSGLISDLLELAYMEDAQPEFRMIPFDLSEVITDAAAQIENAAEEKELRIIKTIEPGVAVESDKERVRQILDILLDNAVKYTDTGGEVSITLKNAKRHAECVIRNSGEGIPEENLSRLFNRFYRADSARSSENGGYGLGLAIAKAVSGLLGAKLSADSKPGEYTEFCLKLEKQ